MDLDRFTTAQLAQLHTDACNRSNAKYTAATDVIRAAADIPLHDDDAYQANKAQWRALMAAGDEQHELGRDIFAELRRRETVNA